MAGESNPAEKTALILVRPYLGPHCLDIGYKQELKAVWMKSCLI